MLVQWKISDDNYRQQPRAYVTIQAPSRFYRLTPLEARALREQLTRAIDAAEAADGIAEQRSVLAPPGERIALWLDGTSEPGRVSWIVSLEDEGGSDPIASFPGDADGYARAKDRAAREAAERKLPWQEEDAR